MHHASSARFFLGHRMNLANARTLAFFAFTLAATTVGCHRGTTSAADDQRSGGERALGSWRGDHGEAPEPEPAAVELGRSMVQDQRRCITETPVATAEGGSRWPTR